MADETTPETPQAIEAGYGPTTTTAVETPQEAQGVSQVDPSTEASQEVAEAPLSASLPAAPAAVPVIVNNFTRRGDGDAVLFSFVDVVSGPYAGRRGAYLEDLTYDPQTGYPATVQVRTRDADNLLVAVRYSDIRPSRRNGGR
jgi:hypothetical protein